MDIRDSMTIEREGLHWIHYKTRSAVSYVKNAFEEDLLKKVYEFLKKSEKDSNYVWIEEGGKPNSKRKTAYWGTVPYEYGTKTKKYYHAPYVNRWERNFLKLFKYTNRYSDQNYNSALVNKYANGEVGLPAHQDDERVLDKDTPISTISLGATRKMTMSGLYGEGSPTSGLEFKFILENNSMLVFNNATNTHFRHGIEMDSEIGECRYSITLREMKGGEMPYMEEWEIEKPLTITELAAIQEEKDKGTYEKPKNKKKKQIYRDPPNPNAPNKPLIIRPGMKRNN